MTDNRAEAIVQFVKRVVTCQMRNPLGQVLRQGSLFDMPKDIFFYVFHRIKIRTTRNQQPSVDMNMPLTTRKPGKRRIMVQLWGTLDKAIRRDFEALNIKRDRYLNDLLRSEIEELAREVTFRNSDAVRARMQEKKLPDRVKLTIEMDNEVADRIDAVLTEKNIPRDAFINRVLFFLVAKDSMLEALGIEREERNEGTAKPLTEVMARLYNPFAHIRDANDQRFYTLACFNDGPLGGGTGPNLFGMNTAISATDWANLNMSAEDMLAELGLLPDAGSQR